MLFKKKEENNMEQTAETPLWEPAKPNEVPKDIWIPNRRERRLMKKNSKNKNKNLQAMSMLFEGANAFAKNNPQFKQDIYKALYENLKKLEKEKEEELKND